MIALNMDLPELPLATNAIELLYTEKYGLLAIGGAHGNSEGITTVYQLLLDKDIDNLKWELLYDLNEPRIAPSAIMLTKNKMMVMMGYGRSGYIATAETYDFETKEKMNLASACKERSDSSVCLDEIRGKIYLGGGDTSATSMIVEEYDIHKNKWNIDNIPRLSRNYGTRPLLWMENENILAVGCRSWMDIIDLRMDNIKWNSIELDKSLVKTVYADIVPRKGQGSWKFFM